MITNVFLGRERPLPHVLQVTDRIVVLRLGRVVRDAPTSEFDAGSLLGTWPASSKLLTRRS